MRLFLFYSLLIVHFGLQGQATCVTSFQPLPNGCEVSFFPDVQSTGKVDSWSWDFGDGNSSLVQHPTHTYANPGYYIVNLSIITDDSCYASYMDTVSVGSCSSNCHANFSYQADSCTFFFNDLSSSANGVLNWHWDFGDGGSANVPNPVHTYTAAGTYVVTLSIFDGQNCQDMRTDTVVANHCDPNGSFCQADFIHYGDSCTLFFNDKSTGVSAATNWYWNFGDGTSANVPNPVHTYTAAGTYQVTLSITDGTCQDFTQKTVVANHCGPVNSYCEANFGYYQDSSCIIHFYNQSFTHDPADPITNWFWAFGNGSSSTDEEPAYAFSQPGTYPVTLTIISTSGCSDTLTQSVVVQPCGSYCSTGFSFERDSACLYLFNGLHSTSDPVSSWSWDFGDGNSGSGQNPSHSFPQPGTYTVILTTTTSTGCVATFDQTLHIPPCQNGCEADFHFALDPNGTVLFTDKSHSPSPVIAWHWNFGDGQQSSVQNPVHQYTHNGAYPVELSITTLDSCQTTFQQILHITNYAPVCQAGFRYQISDQLVYFKDRSVGQPQSWLWDLGDGSQSTQPNPINFYSKPGTYLVRLTITTQSGCTDLYEDYLQINGCDLPCKADFAYKTTDNCGFEFIDFSRANSQILDWHWDFGDGEQSTLASPTHRFPLNGPFEVKLTIVTKEGCKDQIKHQIRAQNCDSTEVCQAYFRTEVDTLDSLHVFFHGTSSEADMEWRWNFGDGTKGRGQHPAHTYEEAGEYEVKLLVSGKTCSKTIVRKLLVGLPNGIGIQTELLEDMIEGSINLYPNPTKGQFQLEADFKESIPVEWEIIDLRGRKLMGARMDQPTQSLNDTFDIDALAQGVYFFQLRTEEGLLYQKRIVKQ